MYCEQSKCDIKVMPRPRFTMEVAIAIVRCGAGVLRHHAYSIMQENRPANSLTSTAILAQSRGLGKVGQEC
jgi:hypothetical protein